MEHQHPSPSDSKMEKYLGEFVYGGIDGCVTTFAVVSGAVGAGLDSAVILILGFANLIADGFSMSVGAYLSAKSERDKYYKHRSIERKAVDDFPEEERNEILEIYKRKGFEGELLHQVVDVITSNKEQWVDDMMKEELEMVKEDKSPFLMGLNTFISFLVIGLIPLFIYVWDYIYPLHTNLFLVSSIFTGIGFIFVGWVKSRVTESKIWRSILETLFLGTFAAALSFVVGDVIEKIIT